MDLEFISFSDPNEFKSRDAQRRVRSHAMQHVRRRQRLGNQRSAAFRTLQPKQFPEYGNRIFPKSITWHNPELGQGEGIEVVDTSDEDIAGSNRMEQLEIYPVSPTERYIFTIFHHCECFKSPIQSCKISVGRALVLLAFDDSFGDSQIRRRRCSSWSSPIRQICPNEPFANKGPLTSDSRHSSLPHHSRTGWIGYDDLARRTVL
jgi:hypothetical protein